MTKFVLSAENTQVIELPLLKKNDIIVLFGSFFEVLVGAEEITQTRKVAYKVYNYRIKFLRAVSGNDNDIQQVVKDFDLYEGIEITKHIILKGLTTEDILK